MNVIVYTDASGQLQRIIPVGPKFDTEVEADYLARIAAKDVPAGLAWRIVDNVTLPARTSRDGWKDDGAAVVVDQARLDGVAAAALTALRSQAKQLFQAMEQSARRDRAVALVTLDEVNLLRDWVTQFAAAVAGATTYAAFKTAVASLPKLPQRTAVQARNAVLARIDTAEAD